MLHLHGSISGVLEIIGAFGRREEVEEIADLAPGVFDGSGFGMA